MTDRLLRPGDWARLVLAASDGSPRQRARDQHADLAGGEIRRQILNRLVELDPEPSQLVEVLHEIIVKSGDPSGPVRGVALSIRDEFDNSVANPELLAWLMARALEPKDPLFKK